MTKPLTEKQRLRLIKKAHKNVIKKQNAAKRAALKETRKLTKAVKQAGQHAPKNLDAFSHENMYYTDKEVDRFIENSTIYENYSATLLEEY
jgi:hypothetical protein|tara:strand:- start:231 stop:503 length:273 start_codon:yes stop_codon:yes gene_type:complete